MSRTDAPAISLGLYLPKKWQRDRSVGSPPHQKRDAADGIPKEAMSLSGPCCLPAPLDEVCIVALSAVFYPTPRVERRVGGNACYSPYRPLLVALSTCGPRGQSRPKLTRLVRQSPIAAGVCGWLAAGHHSLRRNRGNARIAGSRLRTCPATGNLLLRGVCSRPAGSCRGGLARTTPWGTQWWQLDGTAATCGGLTPTQNAACRMPCASLPA